MLRNHSALNMPNKFKMARQFLNQENGITSYEKARMALKLLMNYGKNKNNKAVKRRAE